MSERSLDFALQLTTALREHRRRVERGGGAVSPGLLDLLSIAEFRVSRDQAGSVFRDQPNPDDGPGMVPLVMTYRETADALRVSEPTIKRMVRAGDLPVVQIGASTRIPVDAVRGYVEERSHPREGGIR